MKLRAREASMAHGAVEASSGLEEAGGGVACLADVRAHVGECGLACGCTHGAWKAALHAVHHGSLVHARRHGLLPDFFACFAWSMVD